MGQAAMSGRTGCALLKPTHLRGIKFIKTLRQGRSMRRPVGYWAGAGVWIRARRGLPLPAVMAPGRWLFCGAELPLHPSLYSLPAGVAEQVRLPAPSRPRHGAAADARGAVQGHRGHAAVRRPGGHWHPGSVLKVQWEMGELSPVPPNCPLQPAPLSWDRGRIPTARDPSVIPSPSPGRGHSRG